jgi:hypothetical protein
MVLEDVPVLIHQDGVDRHGTDVKTYVGHLFLQKTFVFGDGPLVCENGKNRRRHTSCVVAGAADEDRYA